MPRDSLLTLRQRDSVIQFMFGIGVTELIVILVVDMFIFGPKNRPELGTFVGAHLKDFREALDQKNAAEEPDIDREPPAANPAASDTVTVDESTVEENTEKKHP